MRLKPPGPFSRSVYQVKMMTAEQVHILSLMSCPKNKEGQRRYGGEAGNAPQKQQWTSKKCVRNLSKEIAANSRQCTPGWRTQPGAAETMLVWTALRGARMPYSQHNIGIRPAAIRSAAARTVPAGRPAFCSCLGHRHRGEASVLEPGLQDVTLGGNVQHAWPPWPLAALGGRPCSRSTSAL